MGPLFHRIAQSIHKHTTQITIQAHRAALLHPHAAAAASQALNQANQLGKQAIQSTVEAGAKKGFEKLGELVEKLDRSGSIEAAPVKLPEVKRVEPILQNPVAILRDPFANWDKPHSQSSVKAGKGQVKPLPIIRQPLPKAK